MYVFFKNLHFNLFGMNLHVTLNLLEHLASQFPSADTFSSPFQDLLLCMLAEVFCVINYITFYAVAWGGEKKNTISYGS